MSINFDNALGIHADALAFRAKRAEMIANNLSNADTPGYKATDMSFKEVLMGTQGRSVSLRTTSSRHMVGNITPIFGDKLYRVPVQPSVDGNTVSTELEEANYMRNALEFQASFTFLNGKFRGLTKAIRGD